MENLQFLDFSKPIKKGQQKKYLRNARLRCPLSAKFDEDSESAIKIAYLAIIWSKKAKNAQKLENFSLKRL